MFSAGDGETSEEAEVWDLAVGRGRDRSDGGGGSGRTDIHWQAPNYGGTVGGPPVHIGII